MLHRQRLRRVTEDPMQEGGARPREPHHHERRDQRATGHIRVPLAGFDRQQPVHEAAGQVIARRETPGGMQHARTIELATHLLKPIPIGRIAKISDPSLFDRPPLEVIGIEPWAEAERIEEYLYHPIKSLCRYKVPIPQHCPTTCVPVLDRWD